MSKFSKGHSSEKIDGIRSQVNLVIHTSSSISWPSFKLLGQILCELFCWQEFILVFSKEHNSRKGDNSDKKTNTGQPFVIKNQYIWNFETLACTVHKIWHASKTVTNGSMDEQTDARTTRNQYAPITSSKLKDKQWSGTYTIRSHILPSKPKGK